MTTAGSAHGQRQSAGWVKMFGEEIAMCAIVDPLLRTLCTFVDINVFLVYKERGLYKCDVIKLSL